MRRLYFGGGVTPPCHPPPLDMQDEEQRERARSLLAFVVAGWEAGGDAKPPPEWLGALFSEVLYAYCDTPRAILAGTILTCSICLLPRAPLQGVCDAAAQHEAHPL